MPHSVQISVENMTPIAATKRLRIPKARRDQLDASMSRVWEDLGFQSLADVKIAAALLRAVEENELGRDANVPAKIEMGVDSIEAAKGLGIHRKDLVTELQESLRKPQVSPSMSVAHFTNRGRS